MKRRASRTRQPEVLIVVAGGFDEEMVVGYLAELRRAGLATAVVGPAAGALTGCHGLTIRPDLSLAELDPGQGARLVVMPGGVGSAGTLLTDPRLHTLLAAAGHVAITKEAASAFVEAGLIGRLGEPNIVVQGGEEGSAFVDRLVALMDL